MRHVPCLTARSLGRRFVALMVALSFLIMEQANAAQAPAPAAQAAPAAPVDTSPATLDKLLAPVALYPDPLLMQVLAASVNEQEVLDGGNWLLENKSLEGTALDDAAKKAGFGAAMQALFHFPDVVDLMCSQLDWTTQLGDAFNADQAGVLASVQRLRAQAQQYGTLKTSAQQTVTTQTDNGKQVIVIQPANPQVVYVPQYNPQTVYVQQSGPSAGDVAAAAIISFGVGVAIGAMFSSNNYYYPRWGYGGVYYRGGPWYPAHYAYRPVYGGAFRPAYGYRPPAGYPYHRPIHYNNYYNNYRPGGGNYRPPANRPGGGYNRPPGNGGGNTRPPGNGGGNTRPPGNGGGYNRPGTPPANGARPGSPGNGYNKPPTGGTRPGTSPGNGGGNNRPGNPGNGGATRPTTRPAVTPDRGYSRPTTQPATRPSPQQRPTTQQRPTSQQRPATPQQRPATQQARPAQQSRPAAPAFSGGGNGKSTQAASQRGASSRGGRGKNES